MPKNKKMMKTSMSMSGMPSMPYRSMHVEPADNGYIIRCYSEGEGKDKTVLAKNEDEAKAIMMNMMGMANLVGHKEKGV